MKSLRQPYRCRLDDLWRREIGLSSPQAYAHRIGGCQDLIERLEQYGKLDGHEGCVNTVHFNPSGETLVSGSDDCRIIFWDWAGKKLRLSYWSGHESNVFQAKVMPFSDDRSVVSCAADGQVRYAQIREDGGVETKKLAKHQGRAHKLAIEPGSPRLFYSCGEDGVVRHFDLRSSKSTKLFTCLGASTGSTRWHRRALIRLNAIAINPRNPHYYSVGGSDEFARVYDIRNSYINASSKRDQPVDIFTPSHLIGSDQVHITCVAYSLQEELLASYNDEYIYLFEKDMGHGSEFKAASCNGENTSRKEPQSYEGHRNAQTVKGVNFFGPNSEYVVSGSDCGRIFIWKKAGGQLVWLMVGDDQVVNCLEPHPYATVLATSGLDKDVKIWAPIAENRRTLPPDAEEVIEMNKNNPKDKLEMFLQLLRFQHARRHGRSSAARELGRVHDDNGITIEDGDAESSDDDGVCIPGILMLGEDWYDFPIISSSASLFFTDGALICLMSICLKDPKGQDALMGVIFCTGFLKAPWLLSHHGSQGYKSFLIRMMGFLQVKLVATVTFLLQGQNVNKAIATKASVSIWYPFFLHYSDSSSVSAKPLLQCDGQRETHGWLEELAFVDV